MKTKLTLRIDSAVIDVAKELSAQTGKSVSAMVSDYFTVLHSQAQPGVITPRVRRLRGSLGADVDESTYKDHLVEKHL